MSLSCVHKSLIILGGPYVLTRVLIRQFTGIGKTLKANGKETMAHRTNVQNRGNKTFEALFFAHLIQKTRNCQCVEKITLINYFYLVELKSALIHHFNSQQHRIPLNPSRGAGVHIQLPGDAEDPLAQRTRETRLCRDQLSHFSISPST